MKNIVGKPVTGTNFFGRERELLELKRISEDEHVLMLAPRRVGKTSLLNALAAAVDREGSSVGVYASVAAASSELEFVRTLLDAVYATKPGRKVKPKALATWLSKHGRRVKGVKVAGSGVDLADATPAWQEDADREFDRIAQAERPWLMLVDELPVFILELSRRDPTGARVRTFLQWFRNLRQRPATSTKLRFVLAGSIGLDSVTRRHELTDTINDLRDWRLGPYDARTADRFLCELSRSYEIDLSAPLRQRICDEAEWLIPYHLQVIFSALREKAGSAGLSGATLEAAIEGLLGRKTYFSHWEERLRKTLGTPEDDFAREILAACARDKRGVALASLRLGLTRQVQDPRQREKLVAWILDVLSNDGYLVEASGKWRFRSGLLRRYWERHVV